MIGIPLAVHLATGAPLDWEAPRLEQFNYQGGVHLPVSFATMLIALSIYHSAHKAETIRAGIQSVDKGQLEAGYSIGLHRGQAMWLVLVPQAHAGDHPADAHGLALGHPKFLPGDCRRLP